MCREVSQAVICCAVVVCRGLLLLLLIPSLSGRGPAQSAEREWPKRGNKTRGKSFVGFVKGRSQWLGGEQKKKKTVVILKRSKKTVVGFEATSAEKRK